jgi:ClpP class serine protease
MAPHDRRLLEERLSAVSTAQIVDAQAAFPGDRERAKAYTITPDGIAVVDVSGVLTSKLDFWAMLFGGPSSSYPDIQAAYREIDADPMVRGFVSRIDSPGGDVSGLLATMQAIEKVRKPGMAYIDGAGCSAAAGLALAHGKGRVYASPTAVLGCLGAMGTYYTSPPSDRVREFRSALTPLKALGAETPDGAAQYQRLTDAMGVAFLAAVARVRGLTTGELAAEQFGRGAVMSAEDAIAAGLIDGISVTPPFHLVFPAAVAPSRAPAASLKGGAMSTRSKGQPGRTRAEGDMPAEKPLTEWTPEEMIAEIERLREQLADKDAEAADANAVAEESTGEVAKLRAETTRMQASLKALETEARTVRAQAFVAKHRGRGVVAGEKGEAAALKAFLADPALAEETYGSLPDNAAVLRPVGESGTPASVRTGDVTTAAGVRALIQARMKSAGLAYHAARQQVVNENPAYRKILAQENAR